MVETQQSPETLVTDNQSVARIRSGLFNREWNDIADSLMASFGLVVDDVLCHGVTERGFAEEDQAGNDDRIGEGFLAAATIAPSDDRGCDPQSVPFTIQLSQRHRTDAE